MAPGLFQKLLDLGNLESSIHPTAKDWERVNLSYQSLMRLLEQDDIMIYGIHTGYGANVLSNRDPAKWKKNQIELLEYLQVGVGAALPARVVRRALRLQILKSLQGHSGLHPETLLQLVHLSNSPKLPQVPRYGSLGASGDLIPMAHATGPVFMNGGPLGPRDVIGLVNTNSMMSSYAIELLSDTHRILDLAHEITSLVMFSVKASLEPLSEDVCGLRSPEDGYRRSALVLKSILDKNNMNSLEASERSWLQARYSIRCAPMVFGNCLDQLNFAEAKIIADAESVADNPVIFSEDGNDRVLHAGLFYAASTATAADCMLDVIGKASEILDRQILILMDPNLNENLPENLFVAQMGHCKGLHQLISAMNQQLRSHSTPSRLMSFSCEGNNQDVVPCAMSALNQLQSAVDIGKEIVRASLFVALRAAALRRGSLVPSALNLNCWAEFKNEEKLSILEKIDNTSGKHR